MALAPVTRNLRLLAAFWFLREFQLWIPVWIVYLTLERGFTFTQVTSAEALYLLAVLALEVPTGAIADRYGRRISLGLGALSLASSVTIFAFTGSPLVLFASFAWWAVASTLMSGADMALLYDTLKAGGREHEYERLAGRGTAIAWCGLGLATLFGGPVAAVIDIRATILLGAATSLAAAALAFALWEPPRSVSEGSRGVRGYARGIGTSFRDAWRIRSVRYLVLLMGVMVAGLETVHYLVQPYLASAGVKVGPLFSLLQVPIFAAGMAGALMAGRLEQRFGAVPALLGLGVAGGVMLAVVALLPNLWAYGTLPVIVAANSCAWPLVTGAINREVDSERRATMLSITSMSVSVGMALLAPLIGYAVDAEGVGLAFGLGAVVTAIGIGAFGAPALAAARQAVPRLQLGAPAQAEPGEPAGL